MKVFKLEYKKWNKKNIFIKILDVIHPSKTLTLYTEHYNDNDKDNYQLSASHYLNRRDKELFIFSGSLQSKIVYL